MPILKVKVSEELAKKFSNSNVIKIEELFSYYEDNEEEWVDIPVGEKAEDVLKYLKSINK